MIVLEILPFGAVLNFATDPRDSISVRHTYSYFDLSPYGYANVGPFTTAVLSVAILIITLIQMFIRHNPQLELVKSILLGISVITSLMPLMFGIDYFTVIATFISALTVLNAILSTIMLKHTEQ